MRQNIGLLFLTLGSVLLSISVFPRRIVGSWKELPWEQQWFLKLLGEKELFEGQIKSIENALRMQSDKKYNKRVERCGRIKTDLPLIAIVMMVTGFFLCFDYSALWRFLHCIF